MLWLSSRQLLGGGQEVALGVEEGEALLSSLADVMNVLARATATSEMFL